MDKRLTVPELCTTAWDAIQECLGPAEGMRFLSVIRNPSRDYQAWRQQHFKNLTAERLVEGMRRTDTSND